MNAETAGAEELDEMLDFELCGCSTCRQAIDDVLREVQDNLDDPDHCPGHLITRAVMMSAMVSHLLANHAGAAHIEVGVLASTIARHPAVVGYFAERMEAMIDAAAARSQGEKPN